MDQSQIGHPPYLASPSAARVGRELREHVHCCDEDGEFRPPPVAEEWSFFIYQVSYIWYTAISKFIVFAVAIPSGYLTGSSLESGIWSPTKPRRPRPEIAWR